MLWNRRILGQPIYNNRAFRKLERRNRRTDPFSAHIGVQGKDRCQAANLADKLPADFLRIARSYPAVRSGLAHCGEERRGKAKTPADHVADPNGECG